MARERRLRAIDIGNVPELLRTVVARLERATRLPSLDTLQRWATALDVDFTITADQRIAVRPHKAA